MKRWPIIRHIRYWITRYRLIQHYETWGMLGYLPVHFDKDEEELNKIWRGER